MIQRTQKGTEETRQDTEVLLVAVGTPEPQQALASGGSTNPGGHHSTSYTPSNREEKKGRRRDTHTNTILAARGRPPRGAPISRDKRAQPPHTGLGNAALGV